MMEKNITSGAAYSKANSFPSMSVKLICLISVAFANTLMPLYTRETWYPSCSGDAMQPCIA